MYIYDLPYEINQEICRLLDNDDDWKELADLLRYKAFEVNMEVRAQAMEQKIQDDFDSNFRKLEMEQIARRNSDSPSRQLLRTWGQQNHKVGELFISLYRMKHVPALTCLVPIVDSKFHLLYKKLCPNGFRERDTSVIEDKTNKKAKKNTDESSIPLPVKLIEQGVPLPTSSKGLNGTPTDDDSGDVSSSDGGMEDKVKAEIMRNVAAIPTINYNELKEATNNWSASNMLGQGGFAQVFKGEWKQLTVAVKRLRGAVDSRDRELIRELCLNQYRHDNIVPLYGYSYGGAEVCLVYQLMCGGTLDLRLRRKANGIQPLTWSQRHRVAHGVARGLQFLHTMAGTPLIHGDIKPANILLDPCLIPKIGDFGLARKGPYGDNRTHVRVSRVHGTRAYLPDEYLRSGCLSPAVDVFSYGVVMLEIATCLKVLDPQRPIEKLTDFIRIEVDRKIDTAIYEDPSLVQSPQSNPQLCRDFINIGIHCTKYSRHERPTMLDIYKILNGMVVGKPAQ